jgi:hypothetical protein
MADVNIEFTAAFRRLLRRLWRRCVGRVDLKISILTMTTYIYRHRPYLVAATSCLAIAGAHASGDCRIRTGLSLTNANMEIALMHNRRLRATVSTVASLRGIAAAAGVLVGTAVLLPHIGFAAEGGQSPYMSGYQDFLSGIIPEDAGLYLRDALVYSNGTVSRDEVDGRVVVNVHARVLTNMLAPTYVPGVKVLGGTYAFGAIIPLNYPNVTANVQGPGFTTTTNQQRGGLDDVLFTPVILGWSGGNFHWSTAFSVIAPTGTYKLGGLANTSTNRWSFLPQAALTYLDPKTGWNASVAAVFVASTENPLTRYQSGDLVHVDFSGGRYLDKDFMLGVVGYYEQQITGDSGPGALLGPYKARARGIGPGTMYSFKAGNTPITLTAKWTHDFAVQNTLKGDSVTIAVSLKF